MHIRTWCYAVLCLFLPITLPAQKEHKYLDHALPEAWQENDSDFQQTLPVDDQWWKNFNDPPLDSLIEVAVKQNYSVLMAADRIAMAKANLRIQQGSYSPTLGLAAGWTRQQSSGHTSNLPQTIKKLRSLVDVLRQSEDLLKQTSKVFSSESIKKIMDFANSVETNESLNKLTKAQAQHLAERLQAWLDFGESYSIFTQRTSKQTSSVVFVYKAEAI